MSLSSNTAVSTNKPPRLRVLIASNGNRDVAQAQALVVRLSKDRTIEARAVVDDGACSTHRLTQETLTLKNKAFQVPMWIDDSRKVIERGQIDWYKQQAYELCEWADLLVLAPIDADTFAKMLHGMADCLLLEIIRGWDVSKTILLAPGMTTIMWENPQTKRQLSKLKKKWQWVKLVPPVLWHYNIGLIPSTCYLRWDGFSETIDMIKHHAELNTIYDDVNSAPSATKVPDTSFTNSGKILPPELWSKIFQYVGDWELARAFGIYTTIPTPSQWQQKSINGHHELYNYMRSLEWAFLISSIPEIIEKLQSAPKQLRYLSALCVKLIIKFNLKDILAYLEAHQQEILLASFPPGFLPIKASTVYSRPQILEWWRNSSSFVFKTYMVEAVDGASRSGFTDVLEWWQTSGLELKPTDESLKGASKNGRIVDQ